MGVAADGKSTLLILSSERNLVIPSVVEDLRLRFETLQALRTHRVSADRFLADRTLATRFLATRFLPSSSYSPFSQRPQARSPGGLVCALRSRRGEALPSPEAPRGRAPEPPKCRSRAGAWQTGRFWPRR